MEAGLGILGMSTEEFWSCTPPEFEKAWDGYAKANGLRDAANEDRLDDDTARELLDWMDREDGRTGT